MNLLLYSVIIFNVDLAIHEVAFEKSIYFLHCFISQ